MVVYWTLGLALFFIGLFLLRARCLVVVLLYFKPGSGHLAVTLNWPFGVGKRRLVFANPGLELHEERLVLRFVPGGREEPVIRRPLAGLANRVRSLKRLRERLPRFLARGYVIRSVQWHSRIGLSDAMETALGSGLIHMVKSWAIAYLASNAPIHRVACAVLPDFDHNTWQTDCRIVLDVSFPAAFEISRVLSHWSREQERA